MLLEPVLAPRALGVWDDRQDACVLSMLLTGLESVLTPGEEVLAKKPIAKKLLARTESEMDNPTFDMDPSEVDS